MSSRQNYFASESKNEVADDDKGEELEGRDE